MEKFDYGWEVVEISKFRRTTVVLEESIYHYLEYKSCLYDMTVSDIINLIVADDRHRERQYNLDFTDYESGQEV